MSDLERRVERDDPAGPARPPTLAAATTEPPRLTRNRDYQLLMGGRTLSMIGGAMTGLAMMLLAYDLTKNSAIASVVMSFTLVGQLVTGLPAGAYVDRWDRKRVMWVSALASAALLATIPAALVVGHLTIAHLCVVALGIGGLGVFYSPAEQASLRRIVRQSELGTAMSVNQARSSLGSIVGPPLAGVLYGLSRTAPIVGDALANLIAAACALLVRADLRPRLDQAAEVGRRPGAILGDIREGVSFLAHHRVLRAVAIIASLANFGVNAVFTGAILSLQRDGASPQVLGLVETIIGVAGLTGALVAPLVLRRVRVGWLFIAAMAWATGLCLALVAARAPMAVAALMAVLMLVIPAGNAGFGAYFMAETPDRMQGRAMAAFGMLSMGLMPVANILAGVLLEHTTRTVALLPGIVAMALVVALSFGNGVVRTIPKAAEFRRVEDGVEPNAEPADVG